MVNVLMPMAGDGTRMGKFNELPKPIIQINGHPMFMYALSAFPLGVKTTMVVRSEHQQKYNISEIILDSISDAKIIFQNGKLPGAAMSAMLAKDHLNVDMPLAICDCDVFVRFNYNDIINHFIDGKDVIIVTSTQDSPAYSYVKRNETGKVIGVHEKQVVSNEAVSGITFWKSGKDFFKYIEMSIASGDRVNDEFYISPSINFAILDGKIVDTVKSSEFFHIGDEKSLDKFLDGVV